MKYLFCLILLTAFLDLYSKEISFSNQVLDSDSSYIDDSTFFVRIKVVNKHMLPIQYAAISLGTFDNYEKVKYLGESKENGEFSVRLSKKIDYDYLKISYVGYKDYIISIKNKKTINIIIVKMSLAVFVY